MRSGGPSESQPESFSPANALTWIQTHLAALTALGTAFGYGGAYLQALGETKVTGVPIELVSLSWTEATRAALLGCFASGLVALMFTLGIRLARSSVSTRSAWLRAGRWLFSWICFYASALTAALAVGAWTSCVWWVGLAFVSLFEVWGAIRVFARLPPAPGLKTTLDFAELGVLLTLGLAVMLSPYLGENRARNATDYLVVDLPDSEQPSVVLRMNADKGIIAPLHPEAQTYDQNFRVIELGSKVQMHKERLGHLKPRPVMNLRECK